MESKLLPVEELHLDPDNPRLPEGLIGSTETALLKWLNTEGVLNELAASMVTNGFFPHEPLIVMKVASAKDATNEALDETAPGADKIEGETDRYIVVEGNRRFASLSILLQLPAAVEASLNFDFAVAPTQAQLDALRKVPCFVVESKEEVRKFLGFRHIGGIKTWSPEAKARYLDEEVKRALAAGSHNVFRDVGRLVGSNAAGVRGPYVALHILRAARDSFGIDTNFVMQNRFGVWNRMMNSADLRTYIGFGDASTAEEVHNAVEALDAARLTEVIQDLTPTEGQRRSVLYDSRDVTAYAAVLQNDRAHATLRQHLDLALAKQVIDRANFGQKIRSITRSLDLLVKDIDDAEVSEEVLFAARDLRAQARTLYAGIQERLDSDDDD